MPIIAAFAPFPPIQVCLSIPTNEWNECLTAWLQLTTSLLRLPEAKFSNVVSIENLGVIRFITSYLQEQAQSTHPKSRTTSRELHKNVYLVCHRLSSTETTVSAVARWNILADLAWCYHSVASLPKLINQLWIRSASNLEAQFQALQIDLVRKLESGESASAYTTLRRLIPLLRVAPQAGRVLALGSDLIEALAERYQSADIKLQQSLVVFTSVLLLSLVTIEKPHSSLLAEHLYTLKANARSARSNTSVPLLTAIVSETTFMDQLDRLSMENSHGEDHEHPPKLHSASIATGLQEFIDTSKSRKRRGKGRQSATVDAAINAVQEDVYFHRMSKVIEIQEMMPGLGSAFVTSLLREYQDNVELAIDHLLSDSLPAHLADVDRSEQLSGPDGVTVEGTEAESVLDPRPTPPTVERRNIFDGDDFDKLNVAASNWHIGKAQQDQSADDMLSSANPNKSAIYASLAAFDSDDDERDDTYDTTDVGGTVDNTMDADREAAAIGNAERILYMHWKTHPRDFAKDSQTRHSAQRSLLKSQTGWADEQIEGWATMLEREPRRKQQLERRFADNWQGQQRHVESTAWKAQETEEGDGDNAQGGASHAGRGGRPIRGGFRGGRGRGDTAGAPSEAGTQRARRGKEVRGTHNRREGRAKKVARGMAGPM